MSLRNACILIIASVVALYGVILLVIHQQGVFTKPEPPVHPQPTAAEYSVTYPEDTEPDKPQDIAYQRRIKHELRALAKDKAATAQRIAKIRAANNGCWTDERVGVTADGYIFYYDLHESHGMDNIRDIHILYLPDEDRYIITHVHWCYGLEKLQQASSKAVVVGIFSARGW